MEGRLEFRILGPLEVRREGKAVEVGAGRQRALLVLLLLRANLVVERERLVDELWGEAPPETAANALQVYVSQLRTALEPGRAPREQDGVLATRGAGYLLRVEEGALDLQRFERLTADGRRALAAGESQPAARLLAEAIALWRGRALADVGTGALRGEAERLEELRLAAVEDRIEADLALGRHGVLVGELEALVREHPLRERLRGQLMLALYRSGRQAESLEVYRETRRALVGELGIEPGPALRELEQAILAQDPALGPHVEAAPAPAEESPPTIPSEGERRIVSVLLADVADSTAIAERLGPERSKFLFDEIVGLLSAEVGRFGGTVAQLTGDGLFAVFGAPLAHEDDAERAVRAARAIQEALAGYAREMGDAYGVVLAARVAVNTGPVALQPDASPEQAYNALGDTVNVAARLQEHAGPGGVAVGPLTARQVGARFSLESLGALELRGKSAPLEAYRVEGELETSTRQISPLVGREAELGSLNQALGELAQGRGGIVALTGEAGIGKSRLATEARRRWRDRVRFLEAQGVSYAQAIPYHPLRELLRDFAGLRLGEPEARSRLELKARLAGALGERSEDHFPFLASLLGLALERDAETRLRDLSPDSVQRQTHEALIELARALARELPLCLVFDDLHFADEPTLQLTAQLLELTEDEPVCLLLVYRSDPDLPAWGLGEQARRRHRHRFRELELAPLDADGTARLAAATAGAELPTTLVAELSERTGGNPLFLEEAVRDLRERGAIHVDGGRLQLAEQELGLPEAVQEALQARLDRLSPEARETASAAAVVGPSFSLALLERLAPRERLRRALSELQRHELVIEDRLVPTPVYRFRHGLIQEAAYARLLGPRRRELHRMVGETLEELTGESPEEAYAFLGRHFAEAGDPERAARYLLEAGDAAHALYTDEEAIAHYRLALTFLDRMSDNGRARKTLFKIALTHHLAFDYESAQKAYAEACSRPPPPRRRLKPTERIETVWYPIRDLAPGHAYRSSDIWLVDLLFRGLLRLEHDLNVVPDLAESFGVSGDGLTYRFRIRQDARWSDGARLTARDFVDAWSAMTERETTSAFVIEDIASAKAVDEATLEVHLHEARSYFPYIFAAPWTYPWPLHKVRELGDDWRRAEHLIGNGPFTIAEFDEERVVLVVNPHWVGDRGNVGEISFVLSIRGVGWYLDEWRGGRFDILQTGIRDARSDEWNSQLVATLETDYLGFDSRTPPFEDVRVRKAFAHALDRDELAAAGGGLPEPARRGGMLPPPLAGHAHRVGPEFDLELARALLSSAGFPDGEGLPRVKVGIGELRASSTRGAGARMMAALVEQWRQIGAQVDIVVLEDHRDERLARETNAWVEGWIADYPDPDGFLRTLVRSAPRLYRDADLDGLLETARSLRDRDERIRLYQEFERQWISEKAAILPLTYDRHLLLSRPWVDGFWATPLLARATLDEIVVHRPAS